MNTTERINLIKKGKKLILAVEGRDTSLIIWTDKDANGKHEFKDHDTVYMRLEKTNEYTAPFGKEKLMYLKKENETLNILSQFGFKTPISKLNEIIEITKEMEVRPFLKSW